MMWPLIKKVLFLLDAETAHDISKAVLAAQSKLPVSAQDIKSIQYSIPNHNPLGLLNPIGLAAGFDKNAEIIAALPRYGFGYAEIGTVTPKPQGGNEKPRLFRDIPNRSLFNRMGFNNLGSSLVSANLEVQKKLLPSQFRVGVNIGKNKATPDQEASLDYEKCAQAFVDLADYLVINVSSPNTPGLRSLQTAENLKPIIDRVQSVLQKSQRKVPLWVKLAPELVLNDPSDVKPLTGLVKFLESSGVDGLVLTNTQAGTYIYEGTVYQGGFSGAALKNLAMTSLKEAKAQTSLPIISVGGIDSPLEAVERFRAGAAAIQLYSSWIFEGPQFPRIILETLKKAALFT